MDENSQASMKYQVMSIPLLLFFKDGQPIDSNLGVVPESMIRAKVDSLL